MRKAELLKLIEETREMMLPQHLRKVRYRGVSYTVVPLEPVDVEGLVRAAAMYLAIKVAVDRATRRKSVG